MNTLAYILIATAVVSLISLIGIFTFSLNRTVLKKTIMLLVALSAGTMIGGAFLHLLPEAIDASNAMSAGLFTITGFAAFFIIERVLHWRHCHEGKCSVHTFTYMNLIGDGIHNFIDGVVIAVSFIAGIPLGIATTIAIISHEIPQEIGDFAVLIHGGFSRARAIFYNFLSAVTAVLGALFGYFMSSLVGLTIPVLLPIAAGGFIYIAASDLVPELHKEADIKKSLHYFIFFIAGIAFMWFVKVFFGQ